MNNFLCAAFYLFTKPTFLKEVIRRELPRCAIVYPVCNEGIGLYERMAYTLRNNNFNSARLCFLSDSSPDYFEYESDVVMRLRSEFGEDKIYYWHRRTPDDAKPGNIRGWFERHNNEYDYFFVCDADSLIPNGAIQKLIQKAEHPANRDIAIFQTRIKVAHAKTLFSKHQSYGVYLSQQLYAEVKQRIFGSALSYGHNNLIRVSAFRQIDVPHGVLSHDIWDMALLTQKGMKTVFCSDVFSYEEVPSNYVEMRSRDRRWIKGNFQSLKLLIRSRMPIGAFYYVAYGTFVYITQPIFLFWIVFSLLGNSTVFGQYLIFKPIMGTGPSPLYFETYHFAAILLAILYLHKFVVCRSFRDAGLVFKEIILSTMITLNNIVYHSIDIVMIMFQRIVWIPMNKNPLNTLTVWRTCRSMWPSSLVGFFLLWFITHFYSHMSIFLLPIVCCFCLSIPVVYLTSLPLISIKTLRSET
jgi:membrane glycosyltransferase